MREYTDNTPVKKEITGIRDAELSLRHREYGFNCPAVDLDFLLVEYTQGLPVALVEYKHHKAALPSQRHPTYRALRYLADNSKIPFFLAFYWPCSWAYSVHPMNDIAMSYFMGEPIAHLSEQEYVKILYQMRNRIVDKNVLYKLNTAKPPIVGAI